MASTMSKSLAFALKMRVVGLDPKGCGGPSAALLLPSSLNDTTEEVGDNGY